MTGATCQDKSVEFAQLPAGEIEATEHTEECYAQMFATTQAMIKGE